MSISKSSEASHHMYRIIETGREKIHRRGAEIKLIKNLLFFNVYFVTLPLFPFSFTFDDSSLTHVAKVLSRDRYKTSYACPIVCSFAHLYVSSVFMFCFICPSQAKVFLLRLKFIPSPPTQKLMCLTVLKLVWTRIAAPHHHRMVVEPVYSLCVVAALCVSVTIELKLGQIYCRARVSSTTSLINRKWRFRGVYKTWKTANSKQPSEHVVST